MTNPAANWGIDGSLPLGLLAHDLRTPISCICGAAQVALGAAKESAQVEDCLRQILGAAKALDAMTGELLGGASPEAAVFRGEELEEELRSLVLWRAQERAQRLTLDLAALRGRAFAGNRAALCRVLSNLLTNAVKYTPRGGHIALRASLEETGERGTTATFLVTDDGAGMSQDFLRRLYEPYARASETAQEEGLGLGLASVRRQVERLRGSIQVHSRPGEGTAFTVRVPLAEAQERRPTLGSLCGERVLLAEDNPLGGRVLVSLLSSQGASAALAPDGAEAVRLFEASAPGEFTAVLLDMHMPVLDGCAAARALRALPRADARSVPVFALTAGGGEQDEAAALCAGMDACLKKPLDAGVLCAALAACR